MHEILKCVAPDFINNIRELNKRELNKIMSETVCHCKIRENAEIIAKILDCDIDGKIADVVEVVRCENCVHSIKKDYGGVISYEYLCVLKSTVTHLEEHEANYFCADGDKKKKKGELIWNVFKSYIFNALDCLLLSYILCYSFNSQSNFSIEVL